VTIRATFELEPAGSAAVLAEEVGAGLATWVSDEGGRAVLDLPDGLWRGDVALLVSALVAGEPTEMSAFTRCRLVELELPDGLLPGPAFGAAPKVAVGVIVKPSLGLSPAEVAEVIRAAIGAGATFVKDDEKLGDPAWCPFEDRVRAVGEILPPGVTYCPNVTGPAATLLDRARRAVQLGATGLLVNGVAQGLASVVALREAELGVPILVHRAGSGPWCRNPDVGVTGAVLTRLTRLCGADYVIVGAFAGKLFDTDEDVAAAIRAAREPLGGAPPSWVVIGGGIGPVNAPAQAARAGEGTVLLLGSAAYRAPGGIGAAVEAVVAALAAPSAPARPA
jgi:ribulose-bisphosphate carboxylase large chain